MAPMTKATATPRKPKTITVNLREDIALGLGTLPAGQKRVDREKKIIYGVKMLGGSSPNTHGVEGVDGTDYLYETVARAAPLYEGLKANVNHPPRSDPNQERDAYDRSGKYFSVRAKRDPSNPELGEMFGDLQLLPSHRLTESLLDAAENEQLNDCFSLSHNALGKGEIRGRRYVITDIPEARSVDVVADGGSTKSLFESKEKPMSKVKFGKIILESKLPLPLRGKLLELTDLMEMDMDAPSQEAQPDAWKDHLMNAVSTLCKSDDPECHEKAKKILKMLAPEAKLEEGEEYGGKSKEDEKLEKKLDEGCTPAEKAKKDAEMKESREESKHLLQIIGLKAEGPLLEALADVAGLKNKLAIINQLKELSGTKPTTKPPPGPPRQDIKTLQESAPKFDDLLAVQLN
jgi:hypothetical protein